MQTIRDVQVKILEIMKYIDVLCRKHKIRYHIMGGTALGAVRHQGFIPWDDDLDIFMTPDAYEEFKVAFRNNQNPDFVLQEWRSVSEYLEYAKVRMNGTTFIEEAFKDCPDIHHGIYVDIMILHKLPQNKVIQYWVYLQSKFVTLYALSQRNWKPKKAWQAVVLWSLHLLPTRFLALWAYKNIYKYDSLQKNYVWAYFITPAKFRQGIFAKDVFDDTQAIAFENTTLQASPKIKEYLALRYGDYMRLPPEAARKAAVHALIYDTQQHYTQYFEPQTKGQDNE